MKIKQAKLILVKVLGTTLTLISTKIDTPQIRINPQYMK